MPRARRKLTRPDSVGDLHDYAMPRARHRGHKAPEDTTEWVVTDDWPERVPVTKAEVDVFEAHFSDFFDKLLGPRA